MNETTPLTKRDLAEQNIAKVFPVPSEVPVSPMTGGLAFRTMAEVIEGAKMMSMAGAAIPSWLQGNPGGCWAVIIQANQWGLDPISVARMSYEVNGQVGYMSQLIHALIEKRAPLRQRLRFEFFGEDQTRVCRCTGHIRGEVEPLVYDSPPIGQIGHKKSPLWASDPDQQLAYYSSRAWSRRYCPDVLMGIYDAEDDDFGNTSQHIGADRAKDVTPEAATGLQARLRQAAETNGDQEAEGFREGVVEAAIGPGMAIDRPELTAQAEKPTEASSAKAEPAKPASGQRKAKAPRPETEAPAPKKKLEQPAPELPTDLASYVSHVKRWLLLCSTEEAIEEAWRQERRLRNTCGLVQDETYRVRALADQRIIELRQR